MKYDKRKPKLEKIGCYVYGGKHEKGGFMFFKKTDIKDGDVLIYNKGILWAFSKTKKSSNSSSKKDCLIQKATDIIDSELKSHKEDDNL